MLHNHNIAHDAIFIADAHYNSNRNELYDALILIQDKTIKTSQIFLMGDMFDFLSYEITYFRNNNKKIIDMINHISLEIEIIYFEGNHDFNLEKIFPNVCVISRNKQNIVMNLNDKKVSLAHGDIFTPYLYNFYTKIIRNHYILRIINMFDINNFISKRVNNWFLQKNIFHIFKDYNAFAQKRISLYKDNYDFIIEGHFHQGKTYKNYINIPSLAYKKEYLQVKDEVFILSSL